jgi:hypothetical protein
MRELPQAQTKVYGTGTPNETILLAKEDVKLRWNTSEADGTADVYVRLLPEPGLYFEIQCPDCSLGAYEC